MDPNNPEKVIIPPQPPPLKEELLAKQSSPNFLVWLLVGGVIIMFLVVVALIAVGINLISKTARNTATKSTVETPVTTQPITTAPTKSRFASDSGVLKLRDDLVKLQTDINSTDVMEPQLAPPNLDLNIAIQTAN